MLPNCNRFQHMQRVITEWWEVLHGNEHSNPCLLTYGGDVQEVTTLLEESRVLEAQYLSGNVADQEDEVTLKVKKDNAHLSMSRSMLLTVCLLYATLLMFCSRDCHFCLATLGEKVVAGAAKPTPDNKEISCILCFTHSDKVIS